jgi:hypothetical protein
MQYAASYDTLGGMFSSPNDQSSPAIGVKLVSPSDTLILDPPARAIHVTAAGAIRITDARQNDVTVPDVPVGIWPVRASQIWATGTTATVSAIYY